MKVHESNPTNPSNSANVSALHTRGAAPATGGTAGLPGGVHGDDHVQVSALSHRLNTLDAQPAAHASRLIELSGVISADRYHIDAQVLSNKLIQEHMRTAA